MDRTQKKDWPSTKKGDFMDGTHQNGLDVHKKGRFRGRDTSKWTGRPQKMAISWTGHRKRTGRPQKGAISWTGHIKMDWTSTKKGDFVDGTITEYGKDYNKGQGTDDGGDQDTDF